MQNKHKNFEFSLEFMIHTSSQAAFDFTFIAD